jgi:hypothetical protein
LLLQFKKPKYEKPVTTIAKDSEGKGDRGQRRLGINSEKIDQSQTKETHWNLARKETVTEESGVDCSSLVLRTVSYESVSVLAMQL